MRCLDSVFVKVYQVARLLYTDSVTFRHFLASVEVEICASPLALLFLDFVAFFLSRTSASFCGACFVDATGGELSPAILLPVQVLDTLMKGSNNCSAFSDRATWLQLDALFWWAKQSTFDTVLVFQICLAFLGTGIVTKRVGVVSTGYC
jgi:hypothetical protein